MPRRKAVAPAPEPQPARRVKSPALLIGVFVLGLAITVGAVLLGQSDTGQIDVAAAVRQANSNGQTAADGSPLTVPDAAFRNMPNGGLVPQEGGGETAPETQETAPVEVVGEETATSTTEGSEEGSENSAEPVSETETETAADLPPEEPQTEPEA